MLSFGRRRENDLYFQMFERAEQLFEEGARAKGDKDDDIFLMRAETSIRQFYDDYRAIIAKWRAMLNIRDLPKRPLVRRHLARAILHGQERKWDNLSPKELGEICSLMEQNILDEPGNPWNIRYWFNAVRRIPDSSMNLVIDRLQHWQAGTDSLDATYYIYVVHALRAIVEGSMEAREQAKRYLNLCKQKAHILAIYNPNFAFNWLGHGSGLQQLIHFSRLGKLREPNWFRDPENDSMLLTRERGTIVHIKGPTKGQIRHTRSQLDVHFTPGFRRREEETERGRGFGVDQFLRGRDEETEVDYFLGFSYTGLRAFDVTIYEPRY